MAPLPIKFQELVQLTSTGVDAQSIGFNSCVSFSSSIWSVLSDVKYLHGLGLIPAPFNLWLTSSLTLVFPDTRV